MGCLGGALWVPLGSRGNALGSSWGAQGGLGGSDRETFRYLCRCRVQKIVPIGKMCVSAVPWGAKFVKTLYLCTKTRGPQECLRGALGVPWGPLGVPWVCFGSTWAPCWVTWGGLGGSDRETLGTRSGDLSRSVKLSGPKGGSDRYSGRNSTELSRELDRGGTRIYVSV